MLSESQDEALQKLEELSKEVRDAQSQTYIGEVRDAMSSAVKAIQRSASEKDGRLLRDALPSEQAAYGGLLKLRAREFEVSRSQQQPSQGSPSASKKRQQQKLDELELEQDENRYETQSQAQESTPEAAAEREVRQILGLLKDLARRQEDLNEELAQLQSALEQAETKEERETIERQLERLREQQQELLRETDELAEKMQQPDAKSNDIETQEKLQQTRENLQNAAESLNNKEVPDALASGKRAERQFEELRDEFRKEAAGQFNDTMREMRREAQKLDEQQQELAEKLDSESQESPAAGLRPEGEGGELQDEVEAQREAIEGLLDRMQETVSDAEESEPLLAQKLYDSYRSTRQRGLDRKMEAASELLKRGMKPQAKEATEQAGQDISQLKQDVEEAAESVLGDETKALARALDELEQLDEQLRKEIQENSPAGTSSGEQNAASDQPSSPSEGETPSGENPSGENPSGENPSGENPSGENPSGENPSGENPSGQGRATSSTPGASQASEPQSGEASGDGAGRPGDQGGELLNRLGQQSAASSPITGDGFRAWSDSLREVEEMVDDPKLRSEASQIRDRAREMRIDLKRNAKEPEWELVEELIATPLRELKQNVSEELMRRSAEKNAAVPLDRDPVPRQFQSAVERYYERIGSGQ